MSRSRNHSTGIRGSVLRHTCFVAASVLLLLQASGIAQDASGSSGGRPDLCLPGSPVGGEAVHPYGRDVPPECRRFLEAKGKDWFVLWDRTLGTPRYLVPARPFPLTPGKDPGEGSATPRDARSAALAFLDEHAEFFGVSSTKLAEGEALPFDDGFLVTTFQVHQGFAVRGSSVRIRLTGDLALRSLQLRVARELPDVGPALSSAEDVERIAAAEGFEERLEPVLQLAFPGGLESAEPAWIVPVSLPEDELEVLYSARDGRRLAALSTVLHFERADMEVEGSLMGFMPPPDDVYAMPFELITDRPQPLVGGRVLMTSRGLDGEVWRETSPSETGEFSAVLPNVFTELGYRLYTPLLSLGSRFRRSVGLPEYLDEPRDFAAGERADLVFNTGLEEFDGFHLLTWAQLEHARKDIQKQIDDHGLPVYQFRETAPAVQLSNDTYGFSYRPIWHVFHMASDEVIPLDDHGLWRKIVPTIVHHEFGHQAFVDFTGQYREKAVNEGLSDALSAYISRVSTLGFTDETTPNTDAVSRDLRDDHTSYPADARRTLAGAFWELWEETLEEEFRPGRPERLPQSPFAFGLLARWLASQQSPGPFSLAVEYDPWIGIELYIEADHPRFGGNRDLRDGVPEGHVISTAFGRRNLFLHAFIRGDANNSADVDIADAITIFNYLFLGGAEPSCPDALDADDSGRAEITDGILLLNYLFLGGRPPHDPFPKCGWDRSPEDGIGCWGSRCPLFPEFNGDG